MIKLILLFKTCVICSILFCNVCFAEDNINFSTKLRGINVYFHANPNEADIKTLNEWGVNTVRLFIHANPDRRDYDHVYKSDNKTLNQTTLTKLDKLINLFSKKKIKVIIATATFIGSNKRIWNDYVYWSKLDKLYSHLAHRYKNNQNVIGFHPIDEPSLLRNHRTPSDYILMRNGTWSFPKEWKNTTKDYFNLVEKIGQTINKISPQKLVVVSGVGIWGFADNYAWMKPVKVKNVLYSFNPYIPHWFANSGKKGKPITRYDHKKDFHGLIKKMEPVKNFANKYKVPIIVIGFGISFHTEKMGAKDWMNDMLGYFEDNNWSWTYFSYGIPFRSPEIVMKSPDGKWNRSENTERLTILKKYWSLNHSLDSKVNNH